MKKRPFVLLEILIAFTLLTLCIVPLMRKPVELYRTQMTALQEVERQRLADLAFADVKVLLLNNGIRWEELPKKKDPKKEFPLSPATIQIPYCEPRSQDRVFTLKCEGEKIGMKGETIRMYVVEIKFPPSKKKAPRYIYRTLVTKLNT
jgi:hypothetical protein